MVKKKTEQSRAEDLLELYVEWPDIRESLVPELRSHAAASPDGHLQILVLGCGNSKLSEHLYDAGFRSITNLDFSEAVISDMLRRNVRDQSDMQWRLMFADDMFDVIVDKGVLDAFMEPEHEEKLVHQYLNEAKRVLKTGGKFVCLTLAEPQVLALLHSQFRWGWKMTFNAIPLKQSVKPVLDMFMVVAEKGKASMIKQIASSFTQCSSNSGDKQVTGLFEGHNNENRDGMQYSNGSDILVSLKDLQLGAEGGIGNLPGRRVMLNLGDESSLFSYKAVLLDAPQDSGIEFIYQIGITIVPESRAKEWMFSSEEGQWRVFESARAARLIMVYLESIHTSANMEDIEKDLSLLAKPLAPDVTGDGSAIIHFIKVEEALTERSQFPIVHHDQDLFVDGLMKSFAQSRPPLCYWSRKRGNSVEQAECSHSKPAPSSHDMPPKDCEFNLSTGFLSNIMTDLFGRSKTDVPLAGAELWIVVAAMVGCISCYSNLLLLKAQNRFGYGQTAARVFGYILHIAIIIAFFFIAMKTFQA